MSEDSTEPWVLCDDCGGIIRPTLVETEDSAMVALACACTVFDKDGQTGTFSESLPDKWYSNPDS